MQMNSIYKESFFLSAGDANPEQEMSLPVLVSKIIDIATAHANALGIGNPSMKEMHAGWVLSRLTIEMTTYPKVNTTYEISTWIESFNRHFSERAFRIASGSGETYGYARSIWMVMDTGNHINVGLSHFNLPQELIYGKNPPIERQVKHAPIYESRVEDMSQGQGALTATHPCYDYRFQYCDLDSYRHVNTVRYVELLLNRFSLEDLDSTMVYRLELSFLHEAKYGMETRIVRSDSETSDTTISCFLLKRSSDSSPILFSRIMRKSRH